MKIRLEFDMPEEKEDLYYAENGLAYAVVVEELEDWLRNMYKYEGKEQIDIALIREKIYSLKESNEVK